MHQSYIPVSKGHFISVDSCLLDTTNDLYCFIRPSVALAGCGSGLKSLSNKRDCAIERRTLLAATIASCFRDDALFCLSHVQGETLHIGAFHRYICFAMQAVNYKYSVTLVIGGELQKRLWVSSGLPLVRQGWGRAAYFYERRGP